jgi:uncharacterized protein YjbI with pentapeptide repeats
MRGRWLVRGPLVAAALAAAALPLVAPTVASAARQHPINCAAPLRPNVDLRGCNLAHRQFQHVNLTGANLGHADLTGASFFNAVLYGANLTGANLTRANLATANLTLATLNHANLFGATIRQTNFSEAQLVGTKSGELHGRPTELPGRFFTKRGVLFGPGVNLAGQWLVHLDLHHADLARCDLAGANLAFANLTRTSLSGTNLLGATLTGATITHTGFHDAELFKPGRLGVRTGGLVGQPRKLPAGFVLADGYFIGPGAYLHNAQLTGLFLPKVNFTGADLDGANFARTVLWKAQFSITALQRTNFSHAGLQGATFSAVNLSSANLNRAILLNLRSSSVRSRRLPPGWANVNGFLVGPGADLSGSNLSFGRFGRANLTGANLRGTNLTGAFLNHTRLVGSLTGRIIVRGTPPLLPRGWQLFRGYLLGPGAVVTGGPFQNSMLPTISLAYAQLRGTDLQNADLAHADLVHASLIGVNLQHANLSRAALGGVTSSRLIGRPAGLPRGWAIVRGSLVHR